MIDLDQVRSFVAVVETGSFHEAARKLGLAQSTVSQHIRKLEEHVGAGLIARSHAGCVALPKGTTFLPHARRLLRTASEALAAVRTDRLAVGAASNIGIYFLPRAVAAWGRQADARPVELSIAANPAVIERLGRGDIDLAVTEWWQPMDGFEAVDFRREPLVVIVSPQHRWAGRRTLSPDELAGEPMIGGEGGTGTGRLLGATFGEAWAARLKVTAELGSTEGVKQAVAAGLGVSIVLACAVAEEVAAGSLAALTLEGAALQKPLYVAIARDTPASSPARVFRDFLTGYGNGAVIAM
jgi:DNA-binding transcriptional LysR family regulator